MLAATGTVTVALVAGCSGGADIIGAGGPATETPAVPGTVSSEIEEFAIVEHEPDFAPGSEDQDFGVVLTIENNGDQQTDLIDYDYELTPYDDDISGITAGFRLADDETDTSMSPGGRGSVMATTSLGPPRDEVARYEVTLDCGFDGTYCE